jgi:putative endonuclease
MMTVERKRGGRRGKPLLLRLSPRQRCRWDPLSWRDQRPRKAGVYEHKTKAVPGFTSRYGVDQLVWFCAFDNPEAAIRREKQLKKWNRAWKVRLIEEHNPDWHDLYLQIA